MTEAGEDAAPAPGQADAAPESDFGATLRAAREAAGMSVAALAGRLRLHPKQVEALERSDLAALPSLIYVRGFVRGSARELKIDPAPLLADLDRRAGVVPGALPPPGGSASPLARFGDGSRAIMVAVVVILVIAGIVGALIPRHRGAATARVDAPPGPAAPSLAEPAEAPPAAEPAAATGAPPAPSDSERRTPAVPPVVKPAAKAEPTPAPARHAPAPPVAGSAPAAQAEVAPAAPNPEIAPVPAAPADPAVAQAAPDLVLRVHAISWVEVVQSNGTTLLAQICPAGSVQEIRGRAPFRIVIGNAPAVDAQFRGVAVDVNRFANVNGVARFTLE